MDRKRILWVDDEIEQLLPGLTRHEPAALLHCWHKAHA